MSDVLNLIPPGDLLVRPPYADQALEGLVRAERYQRTEAMHCRAAVADVLSDDATRIDQLIFGEAFDVLFTEAGRAFGRARRDGVVGWVVLDHLGQGTPMASRRVASVNSALPLNALVADADTVPEADLALIGEFERNPADVAERLVGRAYAAGARTSVSTDATGLVQQTLFACGYAGPRHAEAQAQTGYPVIGAPSRGDIAVWTDVSGYHAGHAAVLVDGLQVAHACPNAGAVVIETLAEVEARLVALGYESAVFRRP